MGFHGDESSTVKLEIDSGSMREVAHSGFGVRRTDGDRIAIPARARGKYGLVLVL